MSAQTPNDQTIDPTKDQAANPPADETKTVELTKTTDTPTTTVEETPVAEPTVPAIPTVHVEVNPVFHNNGCGGHLASHTNIHRTRRVFGDEGDSWYTDPRILVAFLVGFLLSWLVVSLILPDRAIVNYILSGILGGCLLGVVANETEILR